MISTLFVRRVGGDPEADIQRVRIRNEGYKSVKALETERVFRFEGVSSEEAGRLKPLLCHPVSETLSPESTLDPSLGPVIEVGYQRAVTDPELSSILRSARAIGIQNLEWVRIAHRYQFQGVDDSTAREIVNRYFYNPQVQNIISPEDAWPTLKPQGRTGPVESIPLAGLTREQLVQLSERMRLFLNADQMQALQEIAEKLNRDLTDAELEMFAQTWSDHCFHTTWKSLGLLQALWDATNAIDHPLVLSVFEDNAGAFEFYEGWALTIKGETHNSPSAVSPYGGIATKHGGVIRDTLGCGQGAWPIGGSTVMGLGDPRMPWSDVPEGVLHPKNILTESIRGTADYCNPMGIPMMFPVYKFHPGYTGKCFALGHSIGLVPASRARKGHPEPGDLAVLIGGRTGRDGLHGATVSSDSMTSDTAVVDAAHVQIGHPIEERKFMEAIPALRDADCLRAVTDLGAAGLSSAAGEMGSETGVWINLARIPLKTEGLHPWEIWISESQERMLLCVPPVKVNEALNILERFEVDSHIIGKFTNTQLCQVVYDASAEIENIHPDHPNLSGEIVVDLDFQDLRKSCPMPDITISSPKPRQAEEEIPLLKTERQWSETVGRVLAHLNVCDQSPAGHRFDNTIQGFVAVGPYGGKDGRMPEDIWASTPLHGKPYTALTSLGFNPLYGDIDPAGMAKLMIIESVTKLFAVGVDPANIVLCDNFYTPRVTPEIASHLKKMVATCCDLSEKLGTPFISGKDSSSGTFIGKDGSRLDIPPTLAVLALGRMPDVNRLIRKPWNDSGNRLYLIGPTTTELGGSVYLDTLNMRGNRLPDPSVEALQNMWRKCKPLQERGLIRSASALTEGGLLRRLFEMALGSGLGCRIDLHALIEKTGTAEAALFAEMIGTMLIEVAENEGSLIEKQLSGIPVGRITNEPVLDINTGLNLKLPMERLIPDWEKPFREVV